MPVTRSTLVDGLVQEAPEALAAEAHVPLQIYSLARMIASEHSRGSPLEKTAIAHAVVNQARHRRVSVTDLLTWEDGPGIGRYATQHRTASHATRYASTRADPAREDVEIARAVMQGEEPDPTRGARRFFSPSAADKLYRTVPWQTKDAAMILEKWSREGWTPIAIAGIDPAELIFLAKGKIASLSPRGRLAAVAVAILGAAGAVLVWALKKG
jgi:hypothetical protein